MIPLYPTEEQIAERVFGKGKLREWRAAATLWERAGLPQIDAMTGRRFWPAVENWLRRRHGLDLSATGKPDGVEQWPARQKYPHRDSSGEPAPLANVVPIGLLDKT